MLRRWNLAVALAVLLAGADQARAQFGSGYYPRGYGGYGWGGWGGGGTVQGSIASGLGAFAAGAGQYNVETAQAEAIDTDTVMRWNQYMYLSQLEANRHFLARNQEQLKRDAGAGAAVEKQIKENPTEGDISSGNALNAILDQISDPRVHTSALRLAKDKIPGKVVRDIPFVNASEAVTISLDQLTAESGWPIALRGKAFEDERQAYSTAIDKALEEDKNGEISAATLKDVRSHLSRLKAKLEANPPQDKAEFGESEGYLKTLYGMTRMLEKPDVEKVVAELESIKETTLGSLLGFMHTFHLRFGKATTPAQKAAYDSMFPLMTTYRDRIRQDAGLDAKADDKGDTPPSRPAPPTNFFSGMKLDHLEGPRNDNK